MRQTISHVYALLVFSLVLLLAGCAPTKVRYAVPEGSGEKVVQLQASNWEFEPNEIVARLGDTLIFKVENTAGVDHNLTIENEKGNHLLQMELPAGRTVTGELRLTEPGEYELYCDKPFHSSLGMSGRILVGLEGPAESQ